MLMPKKMHNMGTFFCIFKSLKCDIAWGTTMLFRISTIAILPILLLYGAVWVHNGAVAIVVPVARGEGHDNGQDRSRQR